MIIVIIVIIMIIMIITNHHDNHRSSSSLLQWPICFSIQASMCVSQQIALGKGNLHLLTSKSFVSWCFYDEGYELPFMILAGDVLNGDFYQNFNFKSVLCSFMMMQWWWWWYFQSPQSAQPLRIFMVWASVTRPISLVMLQQTQLRLNHHHMCIISAELTPCGLAWMDNWICQITITPVPQCW